MNSTAERVASRSRLPRTFGKLWSAAAFSNLADGLGRTAVPLIATTLTRDPLPIASISALAFLPWLLFGLAAGMIVDRFDRRWIMAVANILRGAAAVALAVLTVTSSLTIWWLFAGVLLFGLGETLFDNATNGMIPALVERRSLDRANGFMQAAQITIDNFIAAPVAGVLFAVSLALPIWVGAVGYIVPIVLALLLPLSAARAVTLASGADELTDGPASAERIAPVSARAAIEYLWSHRFLRSMVVFTGVVGSAFAFAQAPTLLYFLDELHVAPAAIGIVTAGIGIGALAGSLMASRLVERLGRGVVMLVANVVAGLALFGVWLADNAILGTLSYALMAFAVALWNVPWGALRQAVIPGVLFGRVLGIIRSFTWGIFPFATLLGGIVARADLRLPYVIAGTVTVVATVLSIRLLLSASQQTDAET